jgi:carboxyl-terminal processing protease
LEQLVEVLGYTRQRQAGLLVRRQGTAKLMELTLTPAAMQQPSVDRAFLLQPGMGYVRVTSFDNDTAQLLHDSIEKLGGAGLKGLVLDLRDNPGGVLEAGLATAAQFLEPGTRILSARGRNTKTEDLDVPKEAQPYKFPLAVLVNEKTASAAEIVAGAVQDNDRGVVVGSTTFGKGLVQRIYPLTDATGLALTTAYYYTPSGRSIQKPLLGNELERATATTRPEFKTRAGRTVRGGGGIEPDEKAGPLGYTRLEGALEGSGSFASFATEWLAGHRAEAGIQMEITPALLDEFHVWLSQRRIQPALHEWSAERAFITRRLKQEILNQAVSVSAGDELELAADPVVRRALDRIAAR